MQAPGLPTARTALSERDSKLLLARYGIPIAGEALVPDGVGAIRAAEELGFPVVLKLCGTTIVHKTERDLVRLGLERADVLSVDVNPLVVRGALPIAVDALVVLDARGERLPSPPPAQPAHAHVLERFRPLFHPRGVIVAGASNHPGKFGFVALHNLLRYGFRGPVHPVNREGAEVLGLRAYKDVAEVPTGQADLVFVCTPSTVNADVLRAAATVGVRAAFVASGGYRETGDSGRALEHDLVTTADQLGILLAGPNGQGVISTGSSMCAQMVAPYPPPGRISVASQSGNVLSSLLNYSVLSGIGVSKAVSTGNAAQTTLADYLEYFAADP